MFIDAGRRIAKVIGELDQELRSLHSQSSRLVVGVPYLLGTLIATEIIPVYRERFPRSSFSWWNPPQLRAGAASDGQEPLSA